MELFLVRHAIAIPRQPTFPDAQRPLSRQGRKRFRQAVGGLQRLGVRLQRLYHSPWLRAVETAELLTPLLVGEVRCHPALAQPPDTVFLNDIADMPTALVGHEPWMREWLAWLTTGSPTHQTAFAFKKGGVAWLVGQPQPGRMTVRAVLPPKVLRALSAGVAP